jgi:glutathionyl-hydroquinone reductase
MFKPKLSSKRTRFEGVSINIYIYIYIYIACVFYYRTLIKRKVLGLSNSTKITKKRREKEHNKKKK